jgi:hypothetical protein
MYEIQGPRSVAVHRLARPPKRPRAACVRYQCPSAIPGGDCSGFPVVSEPFEVALRRLRVVSRSVTGEVLLPPIPAAQGPIGGFPKFVFVSTGRPQFGCGYPPKPLVVHYPSTAHPHRNTQPVDGERSYARWRGERVIVHPNRALLAIHVMPTHLRR